MRARSFSRKGSRPKFKCMNVEGTEREENYVGQSDVLTSRIGTGRKTQSFSLHYMTSTRLWLFRSITKPRLKRLKLQSLIITSKTNFESATSVYRSQVSQPFVPHRRCCGLPDRRRATGDCGIPSGTFITCTSPARLRTQDCLLHSVRKDRKFRIIQQKSRGLAEE
jgi:hypothetical protein